MSTPILSLKKVLLKVPSKQQPILNELSFDVFPGDFILLLGSNGSGKSTLIKTINGLSRPTAGDLLFYGKSLLGYPICQRSQQITTLTQDLNLSTFSELTVLENCLLALHKNKRSLFPFFKKVDRDTIVSHLQPTFRALSPVCIDFFERRA